MDLYELVFDKETLVPDPREAGRGLKFRTKTIKSGNVLEVEVYPIWKTRSEERRAKEKTTKASQAAVNDRNARKRLDRLVNTNFGAEDLLVTLTYAGAAPDPQQGAKDIRNYIRRVKYYRAKHGLPEMKYIYVQEWEDEGSGFRCQGSEPVQLVFEGMQSTFLEPVKAKRVHYHIIMSGMDRDEAERLWKKGRVNSRKLQPDEFGLRDLTGYLLKAPKTKKRWYGSRNLQEPKITVSDHKFSRRQIWKLADHFDGDEAGAVLRKVYPGYIPAAEPIVRTSEFVSGFYVYARMYRIRGQGSGFRDQVSGIS